jgi:ribosomal protein L7/L12
MKPSPQSDLVNTMTPNESDPLADGLQDAIRDFIESRIVVGDLALPTHYPELHEIGAWQVSFRSHGSTGESLVSRASGDWQPGWYVIALNGFDDPFFIDIDERSAGFPVYYAAHGAERWDAVIVAASLERFGQLLSALNDVKDNDERLLKLIETEADMTNALWSEVHQGVLEREALEKEFPLDETTYDPADFQQGTLVITDVGSRKLKVVQAMKQALGLSLPEVLALARERDIVVGTGSAIQLRRIRDKLVELGATVAFRPDAEPTA